jgi:alpha/beta superfamily hydrolase
MPYLQSIKISKMKKILITVFIYLINFKTFGLKPDRAYKSNPGTYGFKYSELKVQATDLKANINIWDIEPSIEAKKNATILLCNGDSGNMSYYISEALNLAALGYHVITFDYRGFGRSSDFNIDENYLFYNEFLYDFEAVLKYAKKEKPNNQIGTLGFSMGAYFPSISKEKLDFVIADSPLVNPEIFLGRLNKPNVILPKVIISSKPEPEPQLIFIGSEDKLVKFEDLIFNQVKTKYNYAIYYKGNHLDGAYILQDSFFEIIDSFLSKLKK